MYSVIYLYILTPLNSVRQRELAKRSNLTGEKENRKIDKSVQQF